MPTGSRSRRAAAPAGAAAGFVYLGLLWLLAVGSAGLAVVGESWTQAAQRERERELIFRGEQIRAAIERYRRADAARNEWPRTLEQLLEDRRQDEVRHHLRRAYSDPFAPDRGWGEIREAGGGLVGVFSLSDRPALGRGPLDGGQAGRAARVGDWRFVVPGAIGIDRSAASAAPR
jgi:type II secretory pathway pseudopilin PulG